MEWNEFLDKISTGNLDVWCVDLFGGGIDPDNITYYYFYSMDSQKYGNYGDYSNSEVDNILINARREFDEKKRIEMYGRLQYLLSEDLPFVFLYSRYKLFVVNRRMEIPSEAEGRSVNFYRDFCKWKIKRY